MKKSLATWSNHSKSNATWSSYRTAEKMLLLCQKKYKTKFEWPMTKDNTYMWIYWLVEDRGLISATISNYLSGATATCSKRARTTSAERRASEGHPEREKQHGGCEEQLLEDEGRQNANDNTSDEIAKRENRTLQHGPGHETAVVDS